MIHEFRKIEQTFLCNWELAFVVPFGLLKGTLMQI